MGMADAPRRTPASPRGSSTSRCSCSARSAWRRSARSRPTTRKRWRASGHALRERAHRRLSPRLRGGRDLRRPRDPRGVPGAAPARGHGRAGGRGARAGALRASSRAPRLSRRAARLTRVRAGFGAAASAPPTCPRARLPDPRGAAPAARCGLRPQLRALDLAAGGLRQLGRELDDPRVLVGRGLALDVLLQLAHQLGRGRRSRRAARRPRARPRRAPRRAQPRPRPRRRPGGRRARTRPRTGRCGSRRRRSRRRCAPRSRASRPRPRATRSPVRHGSGRRAGPSTLQAPSRIALHVLAEVAEEERRHARGSTVSSPSSTARPDARAAPCPSSPGAPARPAARPVSCPVSVWP